MQVSCLDKISEYIAEHILEGMDGTSLSKKKNRKKLDQLVLTLNMALIQHQLDRSPFESVIMSFVAVRSWDKTEETWVRIKNYTPYLSHMIYCSRAVVLRHCFDLYNSGERATLRDAIIGCRDAWLLIDTPGPIGELLTTCMLAKRIADNTVNEAQVRWSADGQTITCGATQTSVQQMQQLIKHELEAARLVFKRDLCFNLKKIPVYPIRALTDNWDAVKPAASFLTDQRNEWLLQGAGQWLLQQSLRQDEVAAQVATGRRETGPNIAEIISQPITAAPVSNETGTTTTVAEPIIQPITALPAVTKTSSPTTATSPRSRPRSQRSSQAGSTTTVVTDVHERPRVESSMQDDSEESNICDFIARGDAAIQYERAVQRFLQHMMILIHVGSGQAARRPEMLGLRWCNRQADKRNIFIHDGLVIFILTYHKSINRTNASRYPVRCLLPEVGELLVQFLALVQPFRRWVYRQKQPTAKKRKNEYLWTQDGIRWPDQRMTTVFTSRVKAAIGIELNIKMWRQIACGVAIKKFASLQYQLDLDLPGDRDDVNEANQDDSIGLTNNLATAFHLQSSHTVRNGNQNYGGTVNFQNGLTDAALQEYVYASKLWHAFIRPPAPVTAGPDFDVPVREGSPRKRGRAEFESDADLQEPLLERLAFRRRAIERASKPQQRKQWTPDEALVALRRMYGLNAIYRTGKQAEAVHAVISGAPEVVVILGTGEGKSLTYLLPALLPGSGTTVLIVPLVVLHTETIRRCKELNIEYLVKESFTDDEDEGIDDTTLLTSSLSAPLIVVSADRAAKKSFHTFLNQLDVAGRLTRVVVDECHLIHTEVNYRRRLRKVRNLRALRCQFVFLTATMPPSIEGEFRETLYMGQSTIVRSVTIRSDIRYVVFRSLSRGEGVDFAPSACKYIKLVLDQPDFQDETGARAIVYVQTRAMARYIAKLLDSLAFYSDSGTSEEKAGVLARWRSGESGRTIIATGAFGAGIDYPSVRYIFHVSTPLGLINFVQEVGRSGRDGKGGSSVVLLPYDWSTKWIKQDTDGLPPKEEDALQRYLEDSGCRRATLQGFFDVEAGPAWCDDGPMTCDVCSRLIKRREAEDIEMGEADAGSMDDIRGGSRRLAQQVRDEHIRYQLFISQLQRYQGVCMICFVMTGEAGHSFDGCRSANKYRFFDAKKQAQNAAEEARRSGRRRGGWLSKFSACFKCGNPQRICPNQGQGVCTYGDIVIPTCWAGYQVDEWRRSQLSMLADGEILKDETTYMLWLGGKYTLFNIEASRLYMVADNIFRYLEGKNI